MASGQFQGKSRETVSAHKAVLAEGLGTHAHSARSGSAPLPFQFRPACIEFIHNFLRLFHLDGYATKASDIVAERGVFECSAFGLKVLFRFGDTIFHGGELADFTKGKLLA